MALPPYLRYAFLSKDETIPVNIAAEHNGKQAQFGVVVLKMIKGDIGWTIMDIIGIPPSICSP